MHLKMKRLTLSILWILAFATATAQEPATMRYGYDYYPLRGNVKMIEAYSASVVEVDGKLAPDTSKYQPAPTIYHFNREGNVEWEEFFRRPRRSTIRIAPKANDIYYKYDQRGNCSERHVISYEDSTRYSHTNIFEYDGCGLLAQSYDLRADGRQIRYEAYKYNRKGQKVKYQYRSKAPQTRNDMEPNPQTRYKYNADGHCVREVHYNLNGEIKKVVKMSYDAQGNLVKKSSIPKIRPNRNGDIVISTGESNSHIVQLYRYDQRGNCINIRTLTNGKKYKNEMVVEREYDEWNNCIKYRNYQINGDSIRHGYTADYQYEYDAHGNWIKRIEFFARDGVFRPKWITLRQISYYE